MVLLGLSIGIGILVLLTFCIWTQYAIGNAVYKRSCRKNSYGQDIKYDEDPWSVSFVLPCFVLLMYLFWLVGITRCF